MVGNKSKAAFFATISSHSMGLSKLSVIYYQRNNKEKLNKHISNDGFSIKMSLLISTKH